MEPLKMSVILAETPAITPSESEPSGSTNRPSKTRRPYPRTDAGNAESLANLYGTALRFDHRRKRWLQWTGHVWIPDSDGHVMRLAKQAARHRLLIANSLENEDERKREIHWALDSEQTQRINATLQQAKATQPLSDAGDNWHSSPYLLADLNGVIDLHTEAPR